MIGTYFFAMLGVGGDSILVQYGLYFLIATLVLFLFALAMRHSDYE